MKVISVDDERLILEDFVEMPNDVTVYPKNPLNVTQKTSLILRVVLHDAELDKVVLGDVDYDVNERIDAKERYEWFIKSGVSKLFTKADVAEHSQEKDIACSKIYHAYFLDCGHDSVATANIISQYLFGSTAISEKDDFCQVQSSVPEELYRSREKRMSQSNTTSKIIYTLLYLVGFTFMVYGICFNAEKIKNGDIGDILSGLVFALGLGIFCTFRLISPAIDNIKNQLSGPEKLKDPKRFYVAIATSSIVIIGLICVIISFIVGNSSNDPVSLSPVDSNTPQASFEQQSMTSDDSSTIESASEIVENYHEETILNQAANDSRYKTKDLQTFGLYGQVKTVHERRIDSDENGTPSPNSYYMEDYYEFSSAGEAILNGTAKRNQQGYLSSQENDVSSDAWFIKEWTYSADGNVLVFKHSTIGGDTELHYSYDNEGNISMSLSQGMSEEGDEFDVRVHYYIKEKDNQGNWTKLLQKEVTTFGGTQEIEYYFVTRDITYYY